MDSLKRKYTNNTLEEELREIVCTQLQEINRLTEEISLLKQVVAEEQKSRYEAYKRLCNR
jgi:hypothetical protein